MKRRSLFMGFILSGLAGAAMAKTGGAGDGKPYRVGEIVKDTRATQVTPEYYTQLRASISMPAFPSDKKKGEKLFASILGALGGSRDSREINVGIRVTIDGVALPEYSLASFKRDSKTGMRAFVNGAQDFPQVRLEGNEKIVVEVGYRDVQQSQYDLNGVTKVVVGLVPGSQLMSEVSKPFIKQIADMGSGVLGALGSSQSDSVYRDDLSPYSGNNKIIMIPLKTETGEAFGQVSLRLLASPTLSRAPKDVFEATAQDLVRPIQEDPSTLELNVAGVKRSYLDELRALPEFAEMARARTAESIRKYCSRARSRLGTDLGMTIMDRTYLMHRSLNEVDFTDVTTQTEWYHDCFNDAERASLRLASNIDPPLPGSNKPAPIEPKELFAFGCWMLPARGPSCERNAPDPEGTLNVALADQVEFAIDSRFLDTVGWGEVNEVSKATLIAAIKGKASGFSCFNRGMLITVRQGEVEQVFRLEGSIHKGRIKKVVIRPVSNDTLSCTT